MAERKVPEKKIRMVEKVAKLIDENRTAMIVSIKGLPAKQFQEINKGLRGKVNVVVAKKNILIRGIENSKKENKDLKKFIREDTAVLFSNIDPFELAGILEDSKTKARAKIGQEVSEDIVIEAGPTDLIPGPVISELGSLGIQIEIKEGKIHIKQNKVILKKGEKVSEESASLMSKLDIKPISVGFIPLVAYDAESNMIYKSITIDKEGALNRIKDAFAKTKAFAYSIAYYCKETIGLLFAKASSEEKKLSELNSEGKEEKIEENKKEEVKEKKEDAQSDKTEEESK